MTVNKIVDKISTVISVTTRIHSRLTISFVAVNSASVSQKALNVSEALVSPPLNIIKACKTNPNEIKGDKLSKISNQNDFLI